MRTPKQRRKPTVRPLRGKAARRATKKTGLAALRQASDNSENETSSTDPDFVLRSDNTPQPRVIEFDRPHGSWVPIRHAPFRYQSLSRPLRSSRVEQRETDEYVRSSVKDPLIVRCAVYWENDCFLITYCDDEVETRLSYVFPHEVREVFRSDDGGILPGCERLVGQIESVWTEMERRFRSALTKGHCRLLARCESPHALKFTELSAEMFAQYRIIDWGHGVAESKITPGIRLYALHVDVVRSAAIQESVIENQENVAPETLFNTATARIAELTYAEAQQESVAQRRATLIDEKRKIDLMLKRLGDPTLRVARYFYKEHEEARQCVHITSGLIRDLRIKLYGEKNSEGRLSHPTVVKGRDAAIEMRELEVSREARNYLESKGFFDKLQ